MKAIALLASVAAAFPLLAQQQPPGQVGRPDVNRPGPWDNDVLVYRVDADGRSEKLATFERAGVPTLARLKEGQLISAFQHFPRTTTGISIAWRCVFQRRRTHMDRRDADCRKEWRPAWRGRSIRHSCRCLTGACGFTSRRTAVGFPPPFLGNLLRDLHQWHPLRVRAGRSLRGGKGA